MGHVLLCMGFTTYILTYYISRKTRILKRWMRANQKGGIHKLCWPNFENDWLPTYPCWHLWRNSLTMLGWKSAYHWHFEYQPPTSSCQRSLWMPPKSNLAKWKMWFQAVKPLICQAKLLAFALEKWRMITGVAEYTWCQLANQRLGNM